MHVSVNGVRLFFDVEGTKFVPDGPVMREKPTLLLLHGGPGADHSIYRPAYSALSDIAQIVYLDHRGNGRSEDGPQERWTLAQWGDDVRAFCEALGIVDPIVLGASFGGMVAMSYATRHPAHPVETRPDQHRGGRRFLSRAARRTVRALRRAGSRRAGAPAFPGSPRSAGPGSGSMHGGGSRCRITRAFRAIPTPPGARSAGPRCCAGSAGPAARASPSTCSQSWPYPMPDAGARRRR